MEVWGFRTGCRPDGSGKVSKVLVFLLHCSQKFGGSKPGVDLMDHVKSRGFWFLLLHHSRKFVGSEQDVDLMDHVKYQWFWFLLLHHSQKFGGSEPGLDLMDHVKSHDFSFFYSTTHGSLGVPNRV